MGMIEAKTFKTGAEIYANAKLVRARLFSPVRKVKDDEILRKPACEIVIDEPPVKPVKPFRPEWSRMASYFDSHVTLYRSVEEVKSGSSPLWKALLINFNDHVVQYRRHILSLEEGRAEIDASRRLKPIGEIVAETLRFFPSVSVDIVRGSRRTRDVVLPRQIAQYEVKRFREDLSFPHIGRWFGGRDHTTVLHACAKIQKMRDEGKLDWYFNARDTA